MAHEIEKIMYVGEVPWHKLGVPFTEPPTLEQAIVAAGLNWNVKTEPLFTENKEVVEAMVTRRDSDNSILGVVGPNYEPLQNSTAFNFFTPFIESKEAGIECAGSLRQGKKVFILAKINRDPLVIKGNDIVDKYMLLSNSHDGTLSVRVGFTPIRVVCANTLAMAHNNDASKLIRIKHTKNVEVNLKLVQDVMNVANQTFEATAEQYRLLANKSINGADLEKYVKIVFNQSAKKFSLTPVTEVDNGKRVLNNIIPLFEKGRGNDMTEIKGTLWAAYNAVTEYVQYERGKNLDTRLDSTWFGTGAQLNKKALTTALQMVA